LPAIPVHHTLQNNDNRSVAASFNERSRESIARIGKFLQTTGAVEQPQTSTQVGKHRYNLPKLPRKIALVSTHQPTADTSAVKAELVKIRGQNESLGHAIEVLVDCVEDLTDMVVHNSSKSPVDRPITPTENNVNTSQLQLPPIVKQENAIDEAQLLAQLHALIEKDKNTKRRRIQPIGITLNSHTLNSQRIAIQNPIWLAVLSSLCVH
jgi:hypothetical protein